MCVISALKTKDGWVLAKNRDRVLDPNIEFKKFTKNGVEYRNFIDVDTGWSEGVNEYGMCIVNSTLMVHDDEKEQSKAIKKGSPVWHDGPFIKRALSQRDIKKAVKVIVDGDVFGHTLLTNGVDLYVVENVRRKIDIDGNGKKETVEHKMTWYKVEDSNLKYIVRSNHGETFEDAGYPINSEDGKSSRERRKAVESAIEKHNPKNIDELIFNCHEITSNKNSMLNPLREKGKCTVYTTGIVGLVPHERKLYYKPISCKMSYSVSEIEGHKTNYKVFEDNITFESYLS